MNPKLRFWLTVVGGVAVFIATSIWLLHPEPDGGVVAEKAEANLIYHDLAKDCRAGPQERAPRCLREAREKAQAQARMEREISNR